MDVTGRPNLGSVIFANGWDRASALLRVYEGGRWRRYRLPKASHTYDHWWLTEWTRIRKVETERFLMDCHGMFYDLAPFAYGGHIWGVRPIASHLRIIPDFCAFRGMLVMAGNQTTPIGDNNPYAGQPQTGLRLGKTDDLWQLGKPQGWGGPWWEEPVKGGEASDPFLMTGFDDKVVHLYHDADGPVEFKVEVDPLGNGSWQLYATLGVASQGYNYHVFEPGFSAHWVRLTADKDCRATGYFVYT